MPIYSRADLTTWNNSLINDNTSQEVEPVDHREINSYMFESFVNLQDDLYKDVDGSLQYTNPVTSLWDSSPAHDNKLTPKSYVDGLFDSIDFTPYAKLDGSNMPFTGNIIISKSSTDPSQRHFLVEDVTGTAGVRVAFESKFAGSNTEFSIGANGADSKIRFWNGIETSELFNITSNNTDTTFNVFGTRKLILQASGHGGVYGDVINFSNGQPISMLSPLGFRVWSDDLTSNVMYFSTSTGLLNLTSSGQIGLQTDKAVVMGDSTTTTAGAIRYNSSTNKHQGYDGTTWNDLY